VSSVQEKCRPVSSTPVSGTPWCVVWTGDKRVFFYNPSTKQSVWERPTELVGRFDVDELLKNCPENKGKVKKVEATSTTSPQIEQDKLAAAESIPKETNGAQTPSETAEKEDTDEPPLKKLKESKDNDGK